MKKRKLWLVGAVAAVFCWWLTMPALAADHSPKVLSSISANELKVILNGLGFVPELATDKEGDPVLKVSLGGRVATFRSVFVFYEKVSNGRYRDIQLHSAFKRSARMTEAQLTVKVNEFNRRKRFIRLYVDRDGDPAIESDFTLEGGVSEECIKVFLRNYENMVMNFMSFMQQ